jgi:hypothetical protein
MYRLEKSFLKAEKMRRGIFEFCGHVVYKVVYK